jgi:hypothetical protein
MTQTTIRRHNHNNFAIHGRRGARVLVRSTAIKVVARTETTVTITLDKLTFQRFTERGDIGDGTLPPKSFESVEDVVVFANVTVTLDIPAGGNGGIAAITLADVIDALTETSSVTIRDPEHPTDPNVPVVTPVIKPGSIVWVDAHDSADHTHIIGTYLHDFEVNTTPLSATAAYVPFIYTGQYEPEPDYDVDPPIIPERWEGTSPAYFTDHEENSANPDGTPTLFSEYPAYLLDGYKIFDQNGNPTLSRLTISLETIDEYLFPLSQKGKQK